jgi:hypothetical protein
MGWADCEGVTSVGGGGVFDAAMSASVNTTDAVVVAEAALVVARAVAALVIALSALMMACAAAALMMELDVTMVSEAVADATADVAMVAEAAMVRNLAVVRGGSVVGEMATVVLAIIAMGRLIDEIDVAPWW